MYLLGNLFIGQKNIKGSNASNYMFVQFHILFVIEKIYNSISYHASQVLFLVGLCGAYLHAEMQYFLCIAYPEMLSVRPHQVTIVSGPLMPCLKTICMVLFNDVHLHLIFYPITSMAVSFQCVILHIFIFPPLCNTPV